MRPLLHGAACCSLLLSACFSPGDGVPPNLTQIYFPTGLALDDFEDQQTHAAQHLYIASSDFDLQFRSSALVSVNLDLFRRLDFSAGHLGPDNINANDTGELVPRSCNDNADCPNGKACDTDSTGRVASHFCLPGIGPTPDTLVADVKQLCATVGERSAEDKLLWPGRCNAYPLNYPLLTDQVGIGAFATDIVYRPNPADATRGRLFMPVRGDATLHWIDVDGTGALGCGRELSSDGQSCDDSHRAGKKASESPARLRMLPEPFGVDATLNGELINGSWFTQIVVTNQTSGALSLFSNQWGLPQGATVQLTDQLAGLPLAPVTVRAIPPQPSDPAPGGDIQPQPGFLVGYSDAPRIDLVRVDPNTGPTPLTGDKTPGAIGYPLLYFANSTPITVNSIGSDSRDIRIDGSHVYVSNRLPPSLLVGELRPNPGRPAQGTDDLPAFNDSVPLSSGASRVALGDVMTPTGPERRVFVVCFDTRQIFIYDPRSRQIEAQVRTGRGPYALAIDDARHLAYIAHFTDSFLGVISLDQRYPATYATMVATIGQPTPPRASK